MKALDALHQKFMATKIEPIILGRAHKCIDKHKQNGDTAIVITASNTFVTSPIVQRYGIENLLATVPEIKSGRYSWKISGIPCFQSGKIDNLMPWMIQNNENLEGSFFYTDSHNDLPLLELVDNPVAVNADKILTEEADKNGWLSLDWR